MAGRRPTDRARGAGATRRSRAGASSVGANSVGSGEASGGPADAEPAASDLVLLGVVGAPHGVRGEVRIKSFTAEPAALGDYGPLVTENGRTVALAHLRPAREVVIARVEGVTTREGAEALKGARLHVPRARLPAPEDDEFYHADLVGLAAVTETGEPVGRVVALHDFGAGDVVEIAPAAGGATRFLPFTRAVVPIVDLAGRRLVVAPPREIEGEEGDAPGAPAGGSRGERGA